MISYDEALQKVLMSLQPSSPVWKPLTEAAGLVLAAPAKALLDMPRWDNSAMDGFAITVGPKQTNGGFKIIGESYAGKPFDGKIGSKDAIHITTGAVLPEGSDTVVPIEDVVEEGGQIFFKKAPRCGQHVRAKSEEFSSGEILLQAGTTLKAGEVALLASAGVKQVLVYLRPKVAVISTGDELVELGQEPGPGQIFNSSRYFLTTRLIECGCAPVCLGTGMDDVLSLDEPFRLALESDLVITTGGVSVGERDQVQDALERHDFEKIFWKVAIKPGKPVLYGRLRGKPFFGLPGNPAATAATFELFVKPALKKLAGAHDVLPEKRWAILNNDIKGGGSRQAFLWCSLKWDGGGYKVNVFDRQASGQRLTL
ncbi:MAG: molybdopterin molybdotransferase MoeA [Desulfuromonadales bacterium]